MKMRELFIVNKCWITILSLTLTVLLMAGNGVNSELNLHTVQTSAQEVPLKKSKPANKLTGLEAGVTNQGTLKCAFSSLTIVKSWLTYGLGVGVRHNLSKESTILPAFALLQLSIPTNKKLSPYLSLKPGYSLGGGFMFNPEIGLTIKTGEIRYFMIGLGFEYFQVGKNYYEKYIERSTGLTLGLRF